MLYLTDTGRRWDGEKVSVRDKMKKEILGESGNEETKSIIDNMFGLQAGLQLYLHSTFDIIDSVNSGILPNQIMINIHPQRWNDLALPWIREYVMQNLKNVVKRLIADKE